MMYGIDSLEFKVDSVKTGFGDDYKGLPFFQSAKFI